MKPLHLIFIFIIFYSSGYAQQTRIDSKQALGNVTYSVLSPDVFRQENGLGWFLLDGGLDLKNNNLNLQQTDLCNKHGLFCNDLPDARGTFLRGMNLGREESKGDTNNDRKVGSFQQDEFKTHQHDIQLGTRVAGHSAKTKGGEFWGNERSKHKTNWSKPTTSKETRPKNITLYIYIKLNY